MNVVEQIERFRGPLVGLFAAWGRGPRDARDLAHDVTVEAFLSRERFVGDWDDAGAVGAWVRGIARNVHRAASRRTVVPPSLGPVAQLDDLHEHPQAAEESDEHPEAERVRCAVAGLPESWREVLTMRYVEGAGLAEIGALLGLGTRAVEGRLRRARQELKARLETHDAVAASARDEEVSP